MHAWSATDTIQLWEEIGTHLAISLRPSLVAELERSLDYDDLHTVHIGLGLGLARRRLDPHFGLKTLEEL